jgi:hypothetical protein
MDQFLASAPRLLIAIGAIAIGFALIVVFNPPASVCDSQMDLFRQAQRVFLYPSNEKNISKPALVKSLYDVCLQDNGPGGCFELFDGLKKLSIDLGNISRECSEVVAQEGPLNEWLKKSVKLMVQLAWGGRAPASYNERNGWLDSSDVALFCSLRERVIQIYGNGAYVDWRESVLNGLPMADKMEREQKWQRSLFSTQCDSYR